MLKKMLIIVLSFGVSLSIYFFTFDTYISSNKNVVNINNSVDYMQMLNTNYLEEKLLKKSLFEKILELDVIKEINNSNFVIKLFYLGIYLTLFIPFCIFGIYMSKDSTNLTLSIIETNKDRLKEKIKVAYEIAPTFGLSGTFYGIMYSSGDNNFAKNLMENLDVILLTTLMGITVAWIVLLLPYLYLFIMNRRIRDV